MASRRSTGLGAARITPAKARNAIKVAKVVGPVVLPVIAPYAAQAAAFARDRYDRHRAAKLGVPVDELGRYAGKGAGLSARINGVRETLGQLAKQSEDQSYLATTGSTVDKLETAVRAAERMPASRRKAAHRSVSDELDRVEAELLARLGV